MSPTPQKLVILGAGGHGRVVADIAELKGFSQIAFIDMKFPEVKTNLNWPIIGRSFADVSGQYMAFCAIGNNEFRLKELDTLLDLQIDCPTLIHPSASVSRYASIGAGAVVMPNVVINAGAKLGRGVIANSGCTIDHDCTIGNGVHISPGANIAGGTMIGDRTWIGIGACVKENIVVGSDVIAAAGCAIVSSIADKASVFGVPARPKTG
jgi:sugar O-acyltransferase (sialic acid O-acetyltransferase NeuD family)